MVRPSLLSTLVLRGSTVADLARPLAVLLPRLVFGWSFYRTGTGKLRNFDNTVQFFTNLGIPAPTVNAAFVSTLEAVGGIALILGFATRPVAALLSSTMVVALLTADRAGFVNALNGTGDGGLTDVVPVVYLLALLVLFAFGAGTVSIDRLLARWFAPRDSRPTSTISTTLTPPLTTHSR